MAIVPGDTLFEIKDIFDTSVRTSKTYWDYIQKVKHQELKVSIEQIIETLTKPDSVYKSVQDPYIKLFYRTYGTLTTIVVVKYIELRGFVVTCYQTSKTKRKGELLWPK